MERLKTREWKTRDWKTWDQIALLEKAGLENAGTSCVWVAKHNIINVRVVRGHVRVVLKRMYSNSEQTFQQSYGYRRLAIFSGASASDDQLSLLRSAQVVYVDATFRVVPSLYHQLFTIFVPHAEYAFPACFALMTRKTCTAIS